MSRNAFRASRAYQNYLNGSITRGTPAEAEKWRASIPWTDEQVADALETMAVDVEQANPFLAQIYRRERVYLLVHHRLNAGTLKAVLPTLIKVCAVGDCGKRALYRVSREGRCRKHRFVPDQHAQVRMKRLEASYRDIEQARKESDVRDLTRSQFRTTESSKGGWKVGHQR